MCHRMPSRQVRGLQALRAVILGGLAIAGGKRRYPKAASSAQSQAWTALEVTVNNRLARQRRFATLMPGALMILVCQHALAEQSADPPPRLWAGIGLGYGYIQAAPPAPSGAGGVWLETQLGFHMGPHWLAGFELGGLGTRISQENYNPNDSGSSVFGQSITHELLVLEFMPRLDRGWFGGVGVGGFRYDNRQRESALLFNQITGDGPAALGRLGYDWKIGRRSHVGVDFSYERGKVHLDAPMTGRFEASMIGADFYVAYR